MSVLLGGDGGGVGFGGFLKVSRINHIFPLILPGNVYYNRSIIHNISKCIAEHLEFIMLVIFKTYVHYLYLSMEV